MRGERSDAGRGRQEPPPPAWTIGHSNLSLEAFLERLAASRIERVADVRRYPASRRSPHFNRETIETVLGSRGTGYRWFEVLGGRRSGLPERESPNRGLTASGFRAYADYALTPDFQAELDRLIDWLEGGRTAILCAEALWWRCHRRLIADQLVARGGTVFHIPPRGDVERHRLWDLARVTPEGVFYPPTQTELGLET